MLYGVDLLGACVGAVVAAVVLVPVYGVYFTCSAAAVMNGAVLLLLLAVPGAVATKPPGGLVEGSDASANHNRPAAFRR